MTQKQVLPHTAKRLATAMMLLTLLGSAGCMTGRHALLSPAPSATVSTPESRIVPMQSQCSDFGCQL